MKPTSLTLLCALAGTLALISSAEPQSRKAYVPGLGEFMTSIQLRHAKLWYAGAAGNWELASHQLHELKEVFEDTAEFSPTYKGLPIEAMIKANMGKPLDDLGNAIGAKDNGAFARAFDAMTEACNICHAGTERAFIVIQRPTQPPVSNQRFAPARQ